jgi:hypothetical protein
MSYASDAQAVGARADVEVDGLKSENAQLTADNADLRAQVADLTQQVADLASALADATNEPAPTPATLWGSSGLDTGPNSYAAIARLLEPKVMRAYNPGAVTGWDVANGAKVPVGIDPFDSTKFDQNKVADNDTATMFAVRDWMTKGGGWRSWHHEPEGDFPVAIYRAAYANIVALGVGLDRLVPTIMAYTLTPQGIAKWGDPEQFYIDEAGVLGFDAYAVRGKDLAQFDAAAAYAAKKGKPWIIAEFGYQAITSTNPYPTDDQLLVFLQSVVARIRTYSNPPLAVSLMNHGAQTMDGTKNPKSTAYYKSVCNGTDAPKSEGRRHRHEQDHR